MAFLLDKSCVNRVLPFILFFIIGNPYSYALESGTTTLGELSVGGEQDIHTVFIEQGDSFIIGLSKVFSRSNEVLDFGILAGTFPDGTAIAMTQIDQILVVNAPQTGIYTFTVRAQRFDATGPYKLHYLNTSDDIEDGPLFDNTSGRLLDERDMASYSFFGVAGDSLEIDVSGSFMFPDGITVGPRLRFFQPDHTLLMGNTESTFFSQALSQTGRYVIQVESLNGAPPRAEEPKTGSYAINFIYNDESVSATEINIPIPFMGLVVLATGLGLISVSCRSKFEALTRDMRSHRCQ